MTDEKRSQTPFDALNSRGLTGKREYVRSLEQRSDAEALSLLAEPDLDGVLVGGASLTPDGWAEIVGMSA